MVDKDADSKFLRNVGTMCNKNLYHYVPSLTESTPGRMGPVVETRYSVPNIKDARPGKRNL
jgi:hypothetical protein